MRKLSLVVSAVLLVLLLGCGNKGDLVLPEDTATTFSINNSNQPVKTVAQP